MRTIKFRAFDSKTDEMYDPEYVDTYTIAALRNERYTLMQFTGLTDKNGVEIYQGDILELNNETYDPEYEGFYVGKAKVTAQTCGFALEPIPKLTEPNPYDSSMFWHVGKENTTEVIGNIYENKELLK